MDSIILGGDGDGLRGRLLSGDSTGKVVGEGSEGGSHCDHATGGFGLGFEGEINEGLDGLHGYGGGLVRGGEDAAAIVKGFHNVPYEVHKFIRVGLAGEAADFHNTTEGVNKYIPGLTVNCIHFAYG